MVRRRRPASLGAVVRRAILALGLAALPTAAWPDPQPGTPGGGETVDQALCRLIGTAAKTQNLPVAFLTRLLWQESSFRPQVVSPAGAQGVAQFMPGTAADRGLADPFDPEQAIPASAAFLADLARQFGNIGLAAATYNGGPTRVTTWLAGKGSQPSETEGYVPTNGPRPPRRAHSRPTRNPSPPASHWPSRCAPPCRNPRRRSC